MKQITQMTPLVLGIAVAAMSLAAAPAAAPVTDWSNVETVVVRPDMAGPALWHVANDKSEVWILATVTPVPKDLKWDSRSIAGLLKGSNALLLPPTASVGIAEGLWFYMWHMDTLEQPDGKTLEASLPGPLKSRFIAARGLAHQDADRYDKYLPAIAALILESDYQKAIDFSNREPQRTVESLAARAGVPAHRIATYPAMDVIHDVPNMSVAANLACMQYAISDIDTIAAHGLPAAQAWAIGDVAGMKAHYSETRLDACLAQSSAYTALREHGIRDEVNAILGALKKPGKTFVVIPMGFFLRKGSVLDRLEAAGLTVTGPGG